MREWFRVLPLRLYLLANVITRTSPSCLFVVVFQYSTRGGGGDKRKACFVSSSLESKFRFILFLKQKTFFVKCVEINFVRYNYR